MIVMLKGTVMIKETSMINELFVLRALAVFGVITVHATSFSVSWLDVSSALYPLYSFLNRFFAFGTCAFFFLNAFVVFRNYYRRPADKNLFKNFYLKRLKYILLPYFFFSLIYFAVAGAPLMQTYGSFSAVAFDFLIKLARGKAFEHLYFVFVSIQFYLLVPFLLRFFQKNEALLKHGLWMGFLLQWLFVFINNYYLRITVGTGSIAFSYFSYYFLGAYLGVNYLRFQEWLKKGGKVYLLLILWLTCGFFYVWIYYLMNAAHVYYDGKWYTLLWNLYNYTSILVLFTFSFWLYKRLSIKLRNLLVRLGAASFGVYLLHPLFLTYYIKIDFSSLPWLYHISVFAGLAGALLIPWLLVETAYKYTPAAAQFLFGRNIKAINNAQCTMHNYYNK